MTFDEYAKASKVSSKLIASIANKAVAQGLIVDIHNLNENDLQFIRFGISVLNDRSLIRLKLSRLSKQDKQRLIDTSITGLLDRADIYIYTRLSNSLRHGKRITEDSLASECSKYFSMPCEETKARVRKIRQMIWNQRKYIKRKMFHTVA